MDKLNPFSSLQRSLEALKQSECSHKERMTHFTVISDAIVTVRPGTATAAAASYQQHIRIAIATFLLHCEESDSGVRMAAEENLARVIRHCEASSKIARVQHALYQEINKNGNERSLRLSLAIFAHYCGTVQQRKGRSYAQNLLPCVYAISKRREPAVLESLASFVAVFCDKLEGYLSDGEVLKMTELFLEDLGAECATKRRCAAKNTISFIQGSRSAEFYANNTFNRCIEQLLKGGGLQQQSVVLGVLGCFRGILPIVLRSCAVEKAIETFDLCLQFLRDGSHSVINAALEVLSVILGNVRPPVKRILLSNQLDHRRMLLKRKTLKNTIFKMNLSESLLSSRKSSTDARSDLLRPGNLLVTSTPTKFPQHGDDRSLASASDIEIDSLRSMELDADSHSPALQLEGSGSDETRPAADTLSLKSQKSTDSIGSFLNNLLTNTSAESVSKFFRKTVSDRLPDEDDDRLSLESMASSYISSNAETIRGELDVTVEVDGDTDPLSETQATLATVVPLSMPNLSRDTLDVPLVTSMIGDEPPEQMKELFIGAIYDQNLLEFTVRLICSRFLLTGTNHILMPDSVARVSVKSLSLQIVAQCVRLKPEVLCLALEKDQYREEFAVVEILNLQDAMNELSSEATVGEEQLAAAECSSPDTTEENLLEMKEDHFGECTSATYFDYFSPMSLSLDQGLKTKLKLVEENFSVSNNEKLSRELDAILSQSNSGSACELASGRRELLVVPKVITTKGGDDGKILTATSSVLPEGKDHESEQLIADVLLFYDNGDPTLRGNVQLIVGNFLKAAIEASGSYDEFIREKPERVRLFLRENRLLQVVVDGLLDEIHTVVNHALSAMELFFNLHVRSKSSKQDSDHSDPPEPFEADIAFESPVSCNYFLSDNDLLVSIGKLVSKLLLVFHNKYWLVQCKICDLIVQLDFDALRSALGSERGNQVQEQCLNQLLDLLHDSDTRVRGHAGENLLVFMEHLSFVDEGELITAGTSLGVIDEFVQQHILSTFAEPIDQRRYVTLQDVSKHQETVARLFYRISNLLLKISSKNQLLGIINFFKLFLERYNPYDYLDQWNEFNILNVQLSLMSENIATALDFTAQADLLQVCSCLMIVTMSTRTVAPADGEVLNKFIIHLLKLLNIYHHLFNDIKPIVFSKVQKSDLFMNSKELQMINSFGYFGNDHFYLRLYSLVRNSLENYRITINADVGQKLFELLNSTIASLRKILEVKSITSMTSGLRFIEEVLRYLQSFLIYEPEQCIRCTRMLLKFIFQSNYTSRSTDLNYFRKTDASEQTFFERYHDFFKAKSKSVPSELGSYVKLFEHMVISCLKTFTKVSASVQADILDMLCQLLDFNINYQLLDSSHVFVDSIFKHIELIEQGSIDGSERLMQVVVKFLYQLTNLKDKQLVTVPKIINICDSMLANNLIRRTAIASVQALCHEVFFLSQPQAEESVEACEQTASESSTQKEVVLNMLIKFPDDVEAYRIVPMIIVGARERQESGNCELEVLTALLGVLKEGKLLIASEPERAIIQRVFESFGKKVLLESKTLTAFIDIFLSHSEDADWQGHMIHAALIVRYVLLQIEESLLMNHVKLCMQNLGNEVDANANPADVLVKALVQYLVGALEKYRESDDTFDQDIMTRYVETLSKFRAFGEISCRLRETLPLEVLEWRKLPFKMVHQLLTLLVVHAFDTVTLACRIRANIYDIHGDRLIHCLMSTLLKHKPAASHWKSAEIIYLLDHEHNVLMEHFPSFLLTHIGSTEFSPRIVSRISIDTPQKLSTSAFNLMEKSHINCLQLISNGLTDLLASTNIVISRKSALILGLKMEALSQLDPSLIVGCLPEANFHYIFSTFTIGRRRKFPKLFKSLANLSAHYSASLPRDFFPTINPEELKAQTIDEAWYLQQVALHCSPDSYTKPRNIAKLLHEVKSESKLINLLSSGSFNYRLLREIIATSFEGMFQTFRIDCVQFNPHLNYLKVHPMLKVALIVLMRKLGEFNKKCTDRETFLHCVRSVICFLEYLNRLEHLCLFYIDGKFVDRFVKEHLLKSNFFETLLTFGAVCGRALQSEPPEAVTCNELYLRCIEMILRQRHLWNEFNQNDRYQADQQLYVDVVYDLLLRTLRGGLFLERYRHSEVFRVFMERKPEQFGVYLKVITIAKHLVEHDTISAHDGETIRLLESVAISVVKIDRFYMYAITPNELFDCYTLNVDTPSFKLPSVPIEHLYDVEMLEIFLKRINIIGFSSKQQFEELFMSLLVLINREEDPDIVNYHEQREIKNICLRALLDLLTCCYRYPRIGFNEGKYHHCTRNAPIKCATIGLKKLHNIQLLIPLNNVFYQPNLERRLLIAGTEDLYSTGDNAVGTGTFGCNQLSVKYFWEIMETVETDSVTIKNSQYFVEKVNIDVTSSMQLIYDILGQLVEDNPALVLPHMVRFCEICDNREQIKWMNQLMLRLQERVPMEDTLSQQHIIYLLCRLAALLGPSMVELTHLCTIIPTYLKSTQLYIRNATLNGLICLLECLVQTSTCIGALSDELQMLRNVVVNYIIKHGIIDESSTAFSDQHTKIVWTLNFYLIEHTSRFVPDCNLLSNSIISANNILKRTMNLEIYLCILNGLERLVITSVVPRPLLEKMEKLALDLVKVDNEIFSLSALKLLMTCIYHSCADQLENTERCNGIVQDEPEIIIQHIEKIEILFAKIRTTTPQGAKVFGEVLCQLIRDLLPPNEILTKVFKELMLNQPNPDIIAGVTYQLFRSAIDASYLELLQDWLLCSLPNFLAFPQINKSVWCLTVIFLSASLNQHLIKLLPEVLSLPSYQQLNEREICNFILSARDFYLRLNGSQRTTFKEIFQQHDSFVYQSLVRAL